MSKNKEYANFNLFNNIYVIYFLFLLSICATSIAFTYLLLEKHSYLVDNNYDIILKNIPFNWGPLAHNINESLSFHSVIFDTNHYLRKFPLNAVLIVLIFNFSKNIYLFLLFKNIISSTIIFYVVNIFLKFENKKNFLWFIILLSCFFINPYNTSIIFNFVYVDHITAFLLPITYLFLISSIKNKDFYVGICLFILYFTKPSMFFVCLILPIFIVFYENKNNKQKYYPLVFSVLAIITWGFYGQYKTGTFPFGTKLLSNNSYDFSHVANKDFLNYYPDKSVDDIVKSPSKKNYENYKNIQNEWDFFYYFDEKNKRFLKEHFDLYIKGIYIKLKFIFFRIKYDGLGKNEFNERKNEINYSNIINKINLNLAILFCLFGLILNKKKFFIQKHSFYYMIILTLNLMPHIYAWGTNKHLVGIYVMSNIFLVYHLTLFNKKTI